ncbi:MAG: TIM-barrel domain-containing protein [Chitinophagaceae bacterium]
MKALSYHFFSLLVSLLFFYTGNATPADPRFQVVADGVLIFPDHRFSADVRTVKVQVITDRILRVMASPKDIVAGNKLVVVLDLPAAKFTTSVTDSFITIKTSSITARADLFSGLISFEDAAGNRLFGERKEAGRNITPVIWEGQSLYRLRQSFELAADDAIYGLGQHQEDAFNYRDQQVTLFQNNTEVAVPFMLSSKNYGVLWDNGSYSKAGDIRSFLPLSSLQLFDKKNNPGWLTAIYRNDRNKPQEIAFEKAESVIDYAYLGDTKTKLPAEFAIQKGSVSWEGAIASPRTGQHKLRFTYAGYLKVWIDGKLLLDKWRQAWNPGAGVINLSMEKDKKQNIKIEWIPDGGESYLTANWLPPADTGWENTFSFDSEAGRQIDYYVIAGNNMDDVISGYRELTGKAQIVPKWAMGFWQSRERYKTQEEILQAAAAFRKRKIPLDNIVLDWSYWKQDDWGSQDFDSTRFPNPTLMIDQLHKEHKVQLMISVWPKFYEGIEAYKKFDSNGWLYKRNIADRQRDWIAQGYTSTFYDAFNEQARKGFWELIHYKLYVRGVDAWWMDASEPDILSNVSPQKRKEQMTPNAFGTAAEALNMYPLQNAKGIYEGQRGVDPNKRVFLLTRSGFAGSQRYAATIWSGDIASRWEDMKSQISAGLNFSMSGLPYWTMDIGGFSVEPRFEKPNDKDLAEWRELMTRWYQFGAFVPLFRSHGQFPFREIYNIAPEGHPAYASMLYYNRLRYRLMPYIYTLAGNAYHNDATLMRGLVMDFAKDPAVKNIGDQFMFGPSFLINPVYAYQQTQRKLYLPAGADWYDLYTGAHYTGGQTINAAASYERMPVYVKAGSIIPTGPELEYTAQRAADPLIVYIYAGSNGSFELYEDEGLNYNYEKGAFSRINFTYDDAGRTLTISDRKGRFDGMLQQRSVYVQLIQPGNPAGMDFKPSGKKVMYKGKKITVNLDKQR